MRIETLHTLITTRLTVVDEASTVRDAALALSSPGIGLLVVRSRGGAAAGVLTKSDLVRHLAKAESGSELASAGRLMSRAVISCKPGDDLRAVWELMAAQGLQNVPVLDSLHRPLGVLDVRDAMRTLLDAEMLQEHLLSNYVAGIGYR